MRLFEGRWQFPWERLAFASNVDTEYRSYLEHYQTRHVRRRAP